MQHFLSEKYQYLFGKSLREERVPGGLASGMNLEDISKMHNVELTIMKMQLRKGIQVEMEHTPDPEVSKEIALDHLYEDPFYYEKLPNEL